MVQNVICVADNAVEQPLVSGFAELLKRTQIRRSEVAEGTASDERLHALPVGRVGEFEQSDLGFSPVRSYIPTRCTDRMSN